SAPIRCSSSRGTRVPKSRSHRTRTRAKATDTRRGPRKGSSSPDSNRMRKDPETSDPTERRRPSVARSHEARGAGKKKFGKLDMEKVPYPDYKDDKGLLRFLPGRGKIVPRRIWGNCARHQKQLTTAVKRARILAMVPFTSDSYR